MQGDQQLSVVQTFQQPTLDCPMNGRTIVAGLPYENVKQLRNDFERPRSGNFVKQAICKPTLAIGCEQLGRCPKIASSILAIVGCIRLTMIAEAN